MRKSFIIALAAVLLTACGSMAENENKHAETTETTTTALTAQSNAQTTVQTTKESEPATSSVTTTSAATTTQLTTQSTTTKPPGTTTTTSKPASITTTRETVQTTAAATKPTSSTSKAVNTTTAKPAQKVVWSELMLAWRHISEGKKITQTEKELIRNDILDYGLKKFNGKKDIHCHVGNDHYDISYLKPLKMTVQRELTDWTQHAHLDASVDTDSWGLINYAKSEQEIYDIIVWTRNDSLRLIDFGLYSRYELSVMYGDLEYASDIHFNVGFDGTYIWFLNEDYYR